MATIAPLLFLFGCLALMAGAVHFLPITRLRPRRRMAKRLIIGGAIAFAVSLVLAPTPPEVPKTPKVVASAPVIAPAPIPAGDAAITAAPAPAVQEPSTAVSPITPLKVDFDDRCLPVGNVDIHLATAVTADSFPLIAEAVRAIGQQMLVQKGPRATATAMNVMVRGERDKPLLHFTVAGDDIRAAARADRPSGYFLNLARETGFNDISAERAARSYCAGADTAFCVAA